MEWKKKKLCPAIITHDCIQAEITFDRLFVVRSDHSLWMLYPFTSEMWLEFREKRGKNLSFVIPKFVKIMEKAEQISASAMTIAAVKSDRSLWIWNHCGKGIPEFSKYAGNIQMAVTDESGLMALDQTGKLFFWKREEQQYCQNADMIMDEVVSASAGVYFYAAVKKDGSLWTWGRNDCEQLGDGTHTNRSNPVKILEDIIQVSLGARHGAAVDRKHNLWTWGENSFGQLCRGNCKDAAEPIKVAENVKKVSLGYSHTGYLTTDNQLWMAGFNGKYGSLGNGKTVNCDRPVLIGERIKDVALGADRVVCVDEQGDVAVWG